MAAPSCVTWNLLEMDKAAPTSHPSTSKRKARAGSSSRGVSAERSDKRRKTETMFYFPYFFCPQVGWQQPFDTGPKISQSIPFGTNLQNEQSQYIEKNSNKRLMAREGRHSGCLPSPTHCQTVPEISSFCSSSQNLCFPMSPFWSGYSPLYFHQSAEIPSVLPEKRGNPGSWISGRYHPLEPKSRDMSEPTAKNSRCAVPTGFPHKPQEVHLKPFTENNMAGPAMVRQQTNSKLNSGVCGQHNNLSKEPSRPREDLSARPGEVDGKSSFCCPGRTSSPPGVSRTLPNSSVFPYEQTDPNSYKSIESIRSPGVLERRVRTTERVSLQTSSPNANPLDGCVPEGFRCTRLKRSMPTREMVSERISPPHQHERTSRSRESHRDRCDTSQYVSDPSGGQFNGDACHKEPGFKPLRSAPTHLQDNVQNNETETSAYNSNSCSRRTECDGRCLIQRYPDSNRMGSSGRGFQANLRMEGPLSGRPDEHTIQHKVPCVCLSLQSPNSSPRGFHDGQPQSMDKHIHIPTIENDFEGFVEDGFLSRQGDNYCAQVNPI